MFFGRLTSVCYQMFITCRYHVFKKGGRVHVDEKWYYDNNEVVDTLTYLGVL